MTKTQILDSKLGKIKVDWKKVNDEYLKYKLYEAYKIPWEIMSEVIQATGALEIE